MGYINLFLSTPCSIRINHRQLVVRGEEEHSFPVEDLNSVLIETAECTITSYALSTLSDAGAVVFTCDGKHLPNGVILPLNSYYRPLKILKLQQNIPKPLQKQLWQSIVKRKIENQATCVEFTSNEPVDDLYSLAKSVSSDDAKNLEAVAANLYFKKIFGKDFVRRDDSFINLALNYGYSIVRGLIARTLTVYGFEPSIGVHHASELNNFNLADDIIEPFRPIVDMIVFNFIGQEKLTPQIKKQLFALINQDVEINGQIYALSYAVELVVQSLKNCLTSGKCELLLPKILPICMHRYE